MATLAKTSRPKLFGVLDRERLFRLLDRHAAQRAIWICAPPGAGKTTLAASWLEARRHPSLWYQADAGDADAATFFYYLGQAAQAWSGRRKPLPLLTPEYLPDLAGFARRCFRELFDRLPQRATLVLDNHQDAAESAAWRSLTAQALAEIPEHLGAIVISRSEPPAEFARLRANRQLQVLGWDELRLTLDETRQLAAARQQQAAVDALALQRSSDGWVAGLVLMLEHLARAELPLPTSDTRALEPATFGYFANVVFDQVSPDVQRLLLTTSLFPRFTAAMAEHISGVREADRLLLDLCERHYFTDRREHAEAVFQYHALFREFLLERARQRWSSAERRQLEHGAAWLLEANGQCEDAVGLYCRSGDFEAATRLVLDAAPKLLAQGRAQVLAGWIAELAEPSLQAQPWLVYWLAMARAAADPAAGRVLLEHAYARFGESHETRGQLFAACGVVEALCLEWTDFSRLDPWLEPLQRLMPQAVAQSPEIELRALCALLTLALYQRPLHPGLQSCIDRIEQLLQRDGVDAAQKVKAGTRLLTYYFWQGDPEAGLRLTKLLAPLTAHAAPLDQVWAWVAYGYDASLRAEGQRAAHATRQALLIAEHNELGFLRRTLSMHMAYATLSEGDPDAAEPYLDDAASLLDASRHLGVSLYRWDRAWQAALRGDDNAAVDHGRKALEHALLTGIWGPVTFSLIGLAESLVEVHEHDAALACLAQARSRTAELRSPLAEFHILLIQASSALLRGERVQCREDAARALAFGRKHGFVTTTRWLPKPMARLLAFALEHGIEPEYARTLIGKRGLVPPSPELEHWPWPVRVHTLGRFTVMLDGRASVAATAQGRPLELLKALIAAGGLDVHSDVLIERLWPEAVDGRKTLEINLHRLRRLLGSDRACVLHDGRLTLDPGCCWVDVWAFERACDAVPEGADDAAQAAAAAERLLHLYGGAFLAHDAEQPWLLAARERLRSRFLRCVQRLGQPLEGAGRWAEATTLYERGIEADSLAEELYRRLMLCHHACGRRAEALEVYRRCRHTLSVLLGIEPSAATQAAYQSSAQGR